ncbi:hypothetical protein ACYRFT_01620 [Listeria kieliensis]
MDQEIKITNREWAETKSAVDKNSKQTEINRERLDRHSKRLDQLEDANIAFPLAIQEAVKNGMAPVMEKLIKHDEKFVNIEIMKERERAEKAEHIIQEEKDRKKFFVRTIITVVITSVLGGGLGILVTSFLTK